MIRTASVYARTHPQRQHRQQPLVDQRMIINVGISSSRKASSVGFEVFVITESPIHYERDQWAIHLCSIHLHSQLQMAFTPARGRCDRPDQTSICIDSCQETISAASTAFPAHISNNGSDKHLKGFIKLIYLYKCTYKHTFISTRECVLTSRPAQIRFVSVLKCT